MALKRRAPSISLKMDVSFSFRKLTLFTATSRAGDDFLVSRSFAPREILLEGDFVKQFCMFDKENNNLHHNVKSESKNDITIHASRSSTVSFTFPIFHHFRAKRNGKQIITYLHVYTRKVRKVRYLRFSFNFIRILTANGF